MADEQKNKDQAQSQSKSQSNEKSNDHDKLMSKQVEEMENDYLVDETAATVVYPADIGYSSHALVKGPTTSPQFIERARYERERNADPDRENKVFARDVLGLDVEVDDDPEPPEEVYGGKRDDQ